MTNAPTDAPGMTPLGEVIKAAMDRHGWSTHRVAREGGPSASTVGRLISVDPTVDRRPPSDENLRKLADTLRVPLPRLEAAAAETRGWTFGRSHDSEFIQDVIAAMRIADVDTQRTAAAVVWQIVDLSKRLTWDIGLPAGGDAAPEEGDVVEDIRSRVRKKQEALPPAASKGTSRGRQLKAESEKRGEESQVPPDED